jgi:hypothetical protein
MSFVLGLALGFVVVLAVLRMKSKFAQLRREEGVTDEMILQIETRGEVEIDEPLDRRKIAEAEERFWEETWDEPDEY